MPKFEITFGFFILILNLHSFVVVIAIYILMKLKNIFLNLEKLN